MENKERSYFLKSNNEEEAERKRKLEELDLNYERHSQVRSSAYGTSDNGIYLEELDKISLSEALSAYHKEQASKKKKIVVIPKDDESVRVQLRSLNEPTCLFGETVSHILCIYFIYRKTIQYFFKYCLN